MQTFLAPSWILTTNHAASSNGQPVLVRRSTGETYGPGDIVQVYPAWGLLRAAKAVVRLATLKRLDAEGETLVAKFVGNLAPAGE